MCAAFAFSKDQKKKNQVIENRYLTFFMGPVEYALPILRVREIITSVDITPLPDSADTVKGVFQLRGQVIPVIGLRERFHLEPLPVVDEPRRTCVIITEKTLEDGRTLSAGLLVDQVARVVPIDATSIDPFTARCPHQDYILGMTSDPNQSSKVILDVDKLLTAEEIALLHTP